MRVLVTGGTGFVGSHTVAALVAGGHQVRLLVRDRHRVAPALSPLGLQAGDLVTIVGDVTDPAAVEQAVVGCEAVVHAGSVYSLDSRDAGRIRQVIGVDLAAQPAATAAFGDRAPLSLRVSQLRWPVRGTAIAACADHLALALALSPEAALTTRRRGDVRGRRSPCRR